MLGRHPERTLGRPARLSANDARLARRPAERACARARRFLQQLARVQGPRCRSPGCSGEVFADSGYDAATQFEFLGDRKLANLWKLLDLARTFDRSGLFGLAEFIARLGDLVRSQPREEQAATQPENADVVRLMTIHQAKGLEFPVVFVPDAGGARATPAPGRRVGPAAGLRGPPAAGRGGAAVRRLRLDPVAGTRGAGGLARGFADSLCRLYAGQRLPGAVGGAEGVAPQSTPGCRLCPNASI